MLDQKVAGLLNEQVNKEFYSAYLYLDFSNFYKSRSLDGYANWYEIQAREEMDHAMMMIRYLQDNDHEVVLEAIDKPQCKLESPEDPLHAGLEHERYVTKLIHTIYDAADEVRDFRTMRFLDWFVEEQGEEEKNASDMVSRYALFGHDPKGLYALDSEYKSRTYVPSTQE
ncbi:MAG: ferritin [Merdibacter sp.]|nr:ferritin [Merdibacter sp.]